MLAKPKLRGTMANMSDLTLAYYSATQKSDPTETSLLQSMGILGGEFDVAFALNNTLPLATVYNDAIDRALADNYDCLVLVHDDVHLLHDPRPNLKRLFETYDLVGVAGCSHAEIKAPALWHIMGGGFNSGYLHGAVSHGIPDKQRMTSFGEFPHRVVMIDGVFMALSRKVMENVRFDEECPAAFHFYDLIYSFQAHSSGFKVGVGDIFICHESPGLREYTKEWTEGNNYFINKYGN